MAKGTFLTKSEPGVYSFADLVREGKTCWDGVRNYQARNHLRSMKAGDQVLYYHSGSERAVVGIAEVVAEAYPDPGDPSGEFSAVDLRPLRALARPVTLAEIKATPALGDMILLRQSRLSVMPVSKAEFDTIVKMGSK
jgi:predicted RNA-binding protein with PUA-like domain